MQGIIETKIQVDSKANMNFLDTENPLHADLPLLPALRDRVFAFFERFAELIGQIGEFDVAVAFVNMMASIVRHKYPFPSYFKRKFSFSYIFISLFLFPFLFSSLFIFIF
jgi:hypothetical protein